MNGEIKKAKSFDLGTAANAVLIAFGVQIVFQSILSFFSLSDKTYTWIVVIMNQVIFAAVALTFCFWKKVDPLAVVGAKEPPKWYFFPVAILIAICCVTCFAPLSGLFSRLLEKLGYEHTPQYFISRDNAGLFTLAFFALTLLPVLGEEVIFRGVLLSGARKKSPLFAVFYTALIFALFHGNLNQLIHQFLLGMVMGYLAYLTGGIYISAVVHITNNAIAMLLDYGFANNFVDHSFYYYLSGELGAEVTIISMAVSFFGLMMLLVFLTVLLHRERSKVKDFEGSEDGVLSKINAYLIYLSTPTVEREKQAGEEQGSKTPMDGYTRMVVILLVAVLAAVVILTLIPGGK